MKYKAIISDLDGTLLNSEHTISKYTKSVIKTIIDKGIKFYIATGRHHNDVIGIKKTLDLETIMITSNGARVHNHSNKEILACDVSMEVSNRLLDLKPQNGIHANIYVGDNWYTETDVPWGAEFHTESGFSYEIKDFKKLKDTSITKFFYVHEDPKVISEFEGKLRKSYGKQVNITSSLPICLEVMGQNVSKGVAIEKVLEMEGISLEEAIAFGDGFNDFDMLESVGKGFIMKNGTSELKKALPHLEVVESNVEDGVAKKIEELFLK